MSVQNDRKRAVKKLRLLAYSGKTDVGIFRSRIDSEFSTVFLPNNVECAEHRYGDVDCDVLSPEIYASSRVMLYVHGGSFVGGSRRAWRGFCSSLAAKTFSRVVVPEYRLAPAYPYPAAIEDIQTVFRTLFTEEQVACSLNSGDRAGIPEIIIAADGSGAAAVCAFLFNLRERYRNCIKKVIFFSPWLDFSPESKIISSKKISDEIISSEVLRRSVSEYTYTSNTSSPFVSPLVADESQFGSFPPVFIQMGAREILLDDAENFRRKVVSAGGSCEIDVWPDMMFMFQMADEFLNEPHLALDRIGHVVTEISSDGGVQIDNCPRLEHSIRADA